MSTSTTFEIPTSDHLTLLGRRWSVAGGAQAAALIIHGVGEHSGRYDEVAGVMNACGIDVMSYDQRGFGQSEGPRGVIPDALALVHDAAMVFRLLRQQDLGAAAPFLVAHSMGAAVASVAVTLGEIAPRGLVLSSPAIGPRAVAIEGLLRLLLTHFPDAPLDSQITPEQVTHDSQVQDAIRHDPLMHRIVTPRLVISIIDQGREAIAGAADVRVPSLFLVAGDDKLVHPEASRDFATAIGSLATFQEFPGLFHEVFNERPRDRAKVFDAFRTWLLLQL